MHDTARPPNRHLLPSKAGALHNARPTPCAALLGHQRPQPRTIPHSLLQISESVLNHIPAGGRALLGGEDLGHGGVVGGGKKCQKRK